MQLPWVNVWPRLLLLMIAVCAALVLLAKLAGNTLPAGEWMSILFTEGQSDFDPDIYLIDLNHKLTNKLTHNITWDEAPALAPNQRAVVYSSDDFERDAELVVIDLVTLERHRLISSFSHDTEPAWSPDGSRLAYRDDWADIYVRNVDGGDVPRRLTDNPLFDFNPTWSPDGRWIAYIATSTTDPGDLYIMPVDCDEPDGLCGRQARKMTDQPGRDLLPAWSPDGAHIAFVSDRGGGLDVYVMDTDCLDTSEPCIPRVRPMSRERFLNRISQLSWSRDGREVRFVVHEYDRTVIYVLDSGCDQLPDGCILRPLLTLKGR
jgi:dipeptidyl aminopeptidase/acylaminoacyl peptidase